MKPYKYNFHCDGGGTIGTTLSCPTINQAIKSIKHYKNGWCNYSINRNHMGTILYGVGYLFFGESNRFIQHRLNKIHIGFIWQKET
jgi:hypothetical protein